jgi:DNA-binding MarR family transcriptional regulator
MGRYACAILEAHCPFPMSRPRTKSPSLPAAPAAETTDIAGPQPLDTQFLETLIGYNARRAALSIISVFLERMSVYGVRPVDFSVLSLIRHNPGITSRQLCAALGLLPPNLVLMLNQLEERQLVEKRPHPTDGRAVALHLSQAGHELMTDAESTASQLERDATSHMTDHQRNTLMRLLKLVYQPPTAPQRRLAPKAATGTRRANGHPRRPASGQ